MGMKTETTAVTTWTCDCCGRIVEVETPLPSTPLAEMPKDSIGLLTGEWFHSWECVKVYAERQVKK